MGERVLASKRLRFERKQSAKTRLDVISGEPVFVAILPASAYFLRSLVAEDAARVRTAELEILELLAERCH